MNPDFTLTAAEATALATQRNVIVSDDAVFQLTGPGTITCLQGVLTNDLVKVGPQALIWGALLTAKGMIITDLWVRRDGETAWLIVPRSARETVKQLLAKSFPPRLTKVIDHTDDASVRFLLAPAVEELVAIDGAILPNEIAPFIALLLCQTQAAAAVLDQQLGSVGWHFAPKRWFDARKVMHGWPTLGREIDEKTLVQEVRFDELQGVKYDKGCFTGQETVARLHFRGHANRELQTLNLEAPPTTAELRDGDRVIGRISTWGHLGEKIVALAIVRIKKESRE